MHQLSSPHLESLLQLGADAAGEGQVKFGDPFMTPSWAVAPRDLRTLFDVCRFIFLRTPEYRQAGWRTVSHFLTDVEFHGKQAGDSREQREVREQCNEVLRVFDHHMELGIDFSCYGNGFGRIHFPFNRFLFVPNGSGGYTEMSVEQFPNAKYLPHKVQYEIEDPSKRHLPEKRRKRIQVDFQDYKARDVSRIALRRIDPAYAYIQYADRSGEFRIAERFRPEFVTSIKAGDLWNVNDTPIRQLQAIRDDMDYLYNRGEVFHLKAPTVSGISNAGWGIPEVLANFSNIHQLQVLRKTDEAIGLDYMLPLRFVYPNIQGGGTLQGMSGLGDMKMFMSEIKQAIKNRRLDPFTITGMPFAVGYQESSSSGKQLTPKDNMAWQTNALLNGAGYPAEVYTGTMRSDAVGVSLRLFENHWRWLYSALNAHLQWVVKSVREHMQLEPIKCRLAQPRLVEDMDRRNIFMQLAAGGEFTRRRALETLGVEDAVQEAEDRAREDAEIAARRQKVEADAALEAQAGMLSGGGPDAGGAPSGVGYTPTQMAERADEMAKQMLQIEFVGERQKALAQLRATDQNLYALVTVKMKEMRAAARSEGGAQVAQLASA